MAGDYTHYLFGELRQVNESSIIPGTATALKAWLDGWLPQWVQSADEAEPDFQSVQARCSEWQTGDRREEVGVISLPLHDAPALDGEPCVQLICRVYFNWASGGRASRTGHAVLLTEDQWRALDYDPFRLPHLAENAAAFASSAALPFERFGDGVRSADRRAFGDDTALIERWRPDLNRVWQGRPPVRLPADAPPRVYELLLLSLPIARRRTMSCVCGPFGLRRDFQARIDIARGDALSVSEAAVRAPCLCSDRLGTPDLDGCWDLDWADHPLDMPAVPVASPQAGDPSAARTTSGSGVVLGSQPNRTKARLWLGLGSILAIAAGVVWGPGLWEARRLGNDCAAWVRDFDDAEQRLGDTRGLLRRAEALLTRDPDGQVCTGQTQGVRRLVDVYRSRLAQLTGASPTVEAEVEGINRLNADLFALAELPLVFGASRGPDLAPASERLYRLAADWVGAAGTADGLRQRHDWLRADEDAKGLAPNPFLTEVAAQIRALEQKEALAALSAAAARVGSLDGTGLDAVRSKVGDFRKRYPNEHEPALADSMREAAARFEQGALPALEAAFAAFKRTPVKETLAALTQASAGYRQAMAPVIALAPGAVIDTEAFLQALNGPIVEVLATKQPIGYSTEIGSLGWLSSCPPQRDFGLFGQETVCVRLTPQDGPKSSGRALPQPGTQGQDRQPTPQGRPPANEEPPPSTGLWQWLLDLLNDPSGRAPTASDLYRVRLQDLLKAGDWQSTDRRVGLQAKIQWPSLDAFRQ